MLSLLRKGFELPDAWMEAMGLGGGTRAGNWVHFVSLWGSLFSVGICAKVCKAFPSWNWIWTAKRWDIFLFGTWSSL